MSKTHWKKLFNYEYLGSYSIDGEDLVLTIASIDLEMVTGNNGKKEECTVCHFAENQKPMILNRTNCKTIEKLYKSPYKEDWIGKQIRIYSEKVSAFGTVTDALRIRPQIPTKTLPELTPSHKAWGNVVKHISNGNPISDIRKKYTVSKDVENQIKQEAKG
jgi:hypothetical protein